jgi:hypothetical protein
MALVALVTVPDEGAVGVVTAALADAGIEAHVRPATPDHPYQTSALAKPFRISVAEADVEEARKVLARVQHEMAEEVDAQAAAAVPEARARGPESALPDVGHRRPRYSWALALAFIVPFPAVCFYARAVRAGALFLGLFLVSVGYSFTGGIWQVEPLGSPTPVSGPHDQDEIDWDEAWHRGGIILLLAGGAKAADLAVGLAAIARGRRRRAAA